MSVSVYGEFQSTDSAELAAAAVKRTVAGAHPASIVPRQTPAEQPRSWILPGRWGGAAFWSFPAFDGSGNIAGAVPVALPAAEPDGHGSEYPAQGPRGGAEPMPGAPAVLRVEALDARSASQAGGVMRSCGGSGIHES
jgi:hypothetical protein